MIRKINLGIRSKAIRPIFKATYGFFAGICLLHPIGSSAQSTDAQEIHQQHQVSLKSLEGYYQLPNKVAFILFGQQDNILYATQLWDNKKYQLVSKDETHFESTNEGYPIEFLSAVAERNMPWEKCNWSPHIGHC